MRNKSFDFLLMKHDPIPRMPVWEWCAQNVDYSLEPSYEIPKEFLGPFDSNFAPFWKEPVEALQDLNVREVNILKPSRSICTENVVLNTIRYHCAVCPITIYYLGAQQETVERFFEERIEKGLKCVKSLHGAKWRKVGTRLIGDAWQVTASYPGGKSSDKQFGYQLVIVDESSLCDPATVDTLRKRLDSYRFGGHMLTLSSPDAKQKKPSNEDAAFIEFNAGDQRRWHCKDPKTGNLFIFRMGDQMSVDGLKWDDKARGEDGKWNLARVAETVHYLTPDHAVIMQSEKMKIVRAGLWRATNTKHTDTRKRSYHFDALCLPFINGDFDHYACEWLKACAKGQEAIRTFKYEFQAEEFYGELKLIEDDVLPQRQAKYPRATRISVCPLYKDLYGKKRSMTICTIDVQQDSLWWLIREWFEGGDSALVDYGQTSGWDMIVHRIVTHGVKKTFIDQSYKERRNEVFEQCISGIMRNAVPTFGRDTLHMPHEVKERDPFEGTTKQGRHKISMVTFNPDQIKHILYNEIQNNGGHAWMICENIDPVYVDHMRAEKCQDGHWESQHKRNHLWDCEVMQLVGAMVLGVHRQIDMTDIKPVHKPEPTMQIEPVVVAKANVPTGNPKCPRCGSDVDVRKEGKQFKCWAPSRGGGKCLNVWNPEKKREQWKDDMDERADTL